MADEKKFIEFVRIQKKYSGPNDPEEVLASDRHGNTCWTTLNMDLNDGWRIVAAADMHSAEARAKSLGLVEYKLKFHRITP